jgi:hypothetical protein
MTVVRTHGNRFARALCAGLCAVAVLLAGCHTKTLPPPGTPVVTLGDVSGDFDAYQVTIDSITLTATDGSVATVLATPQLVDLARLTEITELLGAPAAASGTYVSAQLTIDYTLASIWYNNNGSAVACSPRTPANAAMGIVVVTVTFDKAHPLVITHGQSSRVAIDVDLAASNSVNTSVSPCIVNVQPFLTMRPAPLDTTPLRARGLLVITEQSSSDFIMNTRPLYDLVSIGIGAVTVKTDAQTYFSINGVTYTGAAGLAVMAQQGLNEPVAAYGALASLSGITPTFNATQVYAGTSLESPLEAFVSGVVAARSGDTLTVHGSFVVSSVGGINFAGSTTLLIGDKTIISQDGVAASGLTPAALSVGQQITASGQATVDSSGNLHLDATAGQVRLASTRLWGTLNSAAPGSLSLKTQLYGNYSPADFNFAGTGAAGQDADPAAYAVNTGALNVGAIGPGTLVAVDGLVTPFGAAPPDFKATAVTVGTATEQKLVVEWFDGTTKPFTSITSAGFVVNLDNPDMGAYRYIATGPDRLDMKTLAAGSPLITTAGAPNQTDLRLAIGSTTLTTGVSMYASASAFTTAVNSTLNGTNKLYRLVAVGQYNNNTNTFVASSISMALHE